MRISDWSSDVCSSDLFRRFHQRPDINEPGAGLTEGLRRLSRAEPIYGQSVLTNAHGERHEIAVAGDRKSVVSGKRVSVRVDLGGRRILKKKTTEYKPRPHPYSPAKHKPARTNR